MRALLLAILVLSSVAFAGWRSLGTVNGTFNDLQVVDAGAVLVSSSTELVLLVTQSDGGVMRANSLAGNFRGGGVFGLSCMAAADVLTSNIVYSTGCGMPQSLPAPPAGARSSGGRLAVLTQSGSNFQIVSGPIASGPFMGAVATWAGAAGPRLRAASASGADFAVANNPAVSEYRVSIDGGPASVVVAAQPFVEASPFERNGSPALLGVSSSALVLHPDILSTASVTPTLPAGFVPRRLAIGRDVAMVSNTTGELASPVPDPANPTMTWRLRPDAGFAVPNAAMHCLDSKWCAVIDSTSRVWLYENATTPVAFVAPRSATAGQTITLTVDAGDGDGDPLFHVWSAGSPAVSSVDGDSVDFTVPLDAGCGPLSVNVTTRDGLFSVVTPATVTVDGVRGALTVSAASGTPIAGGPAVNFDGFIDGGCASASLSWSSSDGQTGTGSRFSYQPAATSCGGQITLTLTATWSTGSPATESRLVQFTLVPWGAPDAPVFATNATQPAGTTQSWTTLNVEHVCATTGGFPGTELLWDPIDAGVAGVTLLDAGLQLTVPALCVDSRFVATARRQVVGETQGRVSTAGTLDVTLVANVPPLDAAANYQVSAAKDGGELYGDTTVVATCLPQRSLESELTVFDGLVAVSSARVPTPGPYVLTLPGGCSTSASLVARLFEDGGFTGATQTIPISLPAAAPAIGALTPTVVTAACGQGVRAQLNLQPVAGACQSAETTWRVVSGPGLDVSSGAGPVIDVQTTQLDLSMVGQPIVFEWSADAGPGNVVTETRTVDVGVDPFVEVRTRTTPLLRREESTVTLEVTLTNTTDCAVQGLELALPVTQASPMLETAQLDGVRVDAQLENGSLVLRDVALEARGSRVLRVAAQPKLLATPTAQPTVTLRGLPVSIDRAAAKPTGCGCSTVGPEWMLVALFAVARRRRR